jgi:hypothetical protein
MNLRKQIIKAQHTVLIADMFLAMAWFYQGLIPKIIFADSGEVEMLQRTGLFNGQEKNIKTLIGVAEIIFGFMFLLIQKKAIHYLNIIALILLAIAAYYVKPASYTFPFNPFSLNISMIGISIIALVNIKSSAGADDEIRNQ